VKVFCGVAREVSEAEFVAASEIVKGLPEGASLMEEILALRGHFPLWDLATARGVADCIHHPERII